MVRRIFLFLIITIAINTLASEHHGRVFIDKTRMEYGTEMKKDYPASWFPTD